MLRFTTCGCGVRHLVRIDRSWWMKLFARRRLYVCAVCHERQFLRRPPAWLVPPTLQSQIERHGPRTVS